jgi:hypothetical protein
MRILGVDPGLSGAHALLAGTFVEMIEPLPVIGGELDITCIRDRWCSLRPDVIVIERSQAFPGQGASSAFNYGATWGSLRTLARVLGFRHELVGPAVWHRALLIGAPKTKDRKDKKDAVIRYVYQAFPRVNLVLPRCRKPHDGMADALCLAEYGRRVFGQAVAS